MSSPPPTPGLPSSAPTDLASMLAEIRARIYVNGVGAITAGTVQGVLSDMLGVLGSVAASAADAEVAALTPGLLSQASAAGGAAGQAAVVAATPGLQSAFVTAAVGATQPYVVQASGFASAASVSAGTAATSASNASAYAGLAKSYAQMSGYALFDFSLPSDPGLGGYDWNT